MPNPLPERVNTLIERLRAPAIESGGDPARGIGRVTEAKPVNPDGPEAADRIEQDAKRIEELEAALRPFALAAEAVCGDTPDCASLDDDCFLARRELMAVHLRDARTALQEPDNG